jgi:hypothetical protein
MSCILRLGVLWPLKGSFEYEIGLYPSIAQYTFDTYQVDSGNSVMLKR